MTRTPAIISDKFSLSLVSSISRRGNSSLPELREKYPGQRKGTAERGTETETQREREREEKNGGRKTREK